MFIDALVSILNLIVIALFSDQKCKGRYPASKADVDTRGSRCNTYEQEEEAKEEQ